MSRHGRITALQHHATVPRDEFHHQDLTGHPGLPTTSPDHRTWWPGLLAPRKEKSMAPDFQTMPETKTQEDELLGLLTERNLTQREGGQA